MSVAYRGVVHGGTIILRESAALTDGTEVVVTPVAETPGSPAAILTALATSPQVPTEWVDELERLIALGRRPPSCSNPFPDATIPSERD